MVAGEHLSPRKGLFRRLFGRGSDNTSSSSNGTASSKPSTAIYSSQRDTKNNTSLGSPISNTGNTSFDGLAQGQGQGQGPGSPKSRASPSSPMVDMGNSPRLSSRGISSADSTPNGSPTISRKGQATKAVADSNAVEPIGLSRFNGDDPDFANMFPTSPDFMTNKRTSSLAQTANGLGVVAHTEPREVTIAQQLFNETATFVPKDEYAAWLGSAENLQVLKIYMSLFDFHGLDILAAMRALCEKLYMRAESQQLNRIMEQFASAWVDMNPHNGFGDANDIYTIGYSFLLLNTDLYASDHSTTKKISKHAYVHNTLNTIVGLDSHSTNNVDDEAIRKEAYASSNSDVTTHRAKNMINDAPYIRLSPEWIKETSAILKEFYSSIAKEALKLSFTESDYRKNSFSQVASHDSGSRSNTLASASNYSNENGPSAVVDVMLNNKPQPQASLLGKMGLSRLRGARTYEHESRIGTSSLDRFNDGYRTNSMRSTFSAESNLTSFGVNKQAAGFAGLLWNSMIKEEEEELSKFGDNDDDDDDDAASKRGLPFSGFEEIQADLEKEIELELAGAPWAKEGILLYRPYIDPNTGKKNRKKEWIQVFTVVQRGQLKMFKFDHSSSSSSRSKNAPSTVGSGNWTESANVVDGFHLCHTLAQEAPSPKKVRGYNGVWSLTLPQRGILVFRTGTPEIAQEFVYTCNYWAARLSKEPFDESVSSMQFGWGILPNSGSRTKYPGDAVAIKEWKPSGHSMVVSDLNEESQLKNLQGYVQRTEQGLAEHNALRAKMLESFSPGSQNRAKALRNWERKSQYLLQQAIRYKTYADSLERALKDKFDKFNSDTNIINNNNTTQQ